MVFKAVHKIIKKKITWSKESLDKLYAFKEEMDGQVIEITMKKNPRSKTLDQIRYIKGIMFNRIAEHCGLTPWEIEWAFKEQYMIKVNEYRDPITKEPKNMMTHESFADVTCDRAAELIGLAHSWAMTMGLFLDAEYQDYMKSRGHKI